MADAPKYLSDEERAARRYTKKDTSKPAAFTPFAKYQGKNAQPVNEGISSMNEDIGEMNRVTGAK